MAYKFIETDNGHKYRLVSKGLLWNSKQDVYLDINAVGRLEMCAVCDGRTVTSRYTSSLEAGQLTAILKKLGVKRENLQKAKFPDTASQKILTEWDHILTWLTAASNF